MRGFFITFEGIDGAGKTTQQHLAAQALREQGYDVLESREPGGTQLAEKVRALVLDPELPLTTATQTLLYLAARSEHVDKLLRPAVEAGKIIICDRFSDSTLVYQGLAQGKTPEEIAQLRRLGSFATGGLEPDLTLVLMPTRQNCWRVASSVVCRTVMNSRDWNFSSVCVQAFCSLSRQSLSACR